MAKDFITNSILQSTANAIRYCDKTTSSIAPKDYADRIRELDKLIPQPDALNFYMPNGGTISLNKGGNPTVVELEYWLDENGRWLIWQEDANGNRSLTLSAGQTVYVRNTSVTSTGFSVNGSNYYKFSIPAAVTINGEVNSLLCKNYQSAVISRYCFINLFENCYYLDGKPIMSAAILKEGCYQWMFNHCHALNSIMLRATDISASNCLYYWLNDVAAAGDFYCLAELTIPTGISGIPSGWTRHDI